MSNTTRGTGIVHSLPTAGTPPDQQPVEVRDLHAGEQIGWLTPLVEPAGQRTELPSRCICTAITAPLALHVADGRVRSCQNLTLHGVYGNRPTTTSTEGDRA